MADLLVVVPSKGRPQSLAEVAQAWTDTGAWQHAQLTFVVDADDPTLRRYQDAFRSLDLPDRSERGPARLVVADEWRPMVQKLNLAAMTWVDEHHSIAFMGDDHRPRSHGWAARYVEALAELGTGIVYGDDLVQGENLPTQWAMTTDIIRALGRMVPADVEHLYCDNSILDLGQAADCIRYLPDVRIEHCHPVAQRGAWDAGYERVNSRTQYARDFARLQAWRHERLAADAAAIRALRAHGGTDGRG